MSTIDQNEVLNAVIDSQIAFLQQVKDLLNEAQPAKPAAAAPRKPKSTKSTKASGRRSSKKATKSTSSVKPPEEAEWLGQFDSAADLRSAFPAESRKVGSHAVVNSVKLQKSFDYFVVEDSKGGLFWKGFPIA